MATIFTKKDFINDFEIMKMNKNSLLIMEKRTHECLFISRNAFNNIMTNRAESVHVEEVQMPNGRVTKWLGIVTTIIF